MDSFFVSDLHGKMSRFKSLFAAVKDQKPAVVFIGGDLLPLPYKKFEIDNISSDEFLDGYIIPHFSGLKQKLGNEYPQVFIILGNDDLRINETLMLEAEKQGLWNYIHNKKLETRNKELTVYGYSCVPPTPFRLKDWERYDVSRFTDVDCFPPDEGFRSVDVNPDEIEFSTIQKDLEILTAKDDLSKSIFLFHSPPYQTNLDRAALDGQIVDSVPLDVHVGSIAIKRFIEERQPCLTLHGHIHESARLTGSWKDKIGNTLCFNAAHDGSELSLIKFNISHPETAERILI
jgi:Icc-related predicted phosphoesterase